MQHASHSARTLRLFRVALALCSSTVGLLSLAWVAIMLGVWRTPGIRIEGALLPSNTRMTVTLRRHALLWAERSLTLRIGYHVFQPTREELGWGLQAEDAESALQNLGRSPNPLVTLRAVWTGLFGAGHDLPWRPRVLEAGALDRYLQRIRVRVERLPIPGSYGPTGTPIEGLAGEAFDIGFAHRAVERALIRGDTTLVIGTIVTPPPRQYRRFERPLEQANIVMTTQETVYRPGTGRAINIERASHLLDGAVMLPGATLSFNAVVGKREPARGFAPALELLNGELTQGVGGGVCQVAGTLHAAAFFAGLTVEEYHAHSRMNRLAYLPPGLDAMVAWPDNVRELRDTKDMRLSNPYPFPIVVKSQSVHSGSQNVLRVQLYGATSPYRVEFQFKELAREPAPEVQRPAPMLPVGEVRLLQPPLDGLVIRRRRTIYTPLRRIDEETRIAYPPNPRIVSVGTKL